MSNKPTLEDLLRTKVTSFNGVTGEEVEVSPSFVVDVQHETDGGVHFIIHPSGHSGITLDFVVEGNSIRPLD